MKDTPRARERSGMKLAWLIAAAFALRVRRADLVTDGAADVSPIAKVRQGFERASGNLTRAAQPVTQTAFTYLLYCEYSVVRLLEYC